MERKKNKAAMKSEPGETGVGIQWGGGEGRGGEGRGKCAGFWPGGGEFDHN